MEGRDGISTRQGELKLNPGVENSHAIRPLFLTELLRLAATVEKTAQLMNIGAKKMRLCGYRTPYNGPTRIAAVPKLILTEPHQNPTKILSSGNLHHFVFPFLTVCIFCVFL